MKLLRALLLIGLIGLTGLLGLIGLTGLIGCGDEGDTTITPAPVLPLPGPSPLPPGTEPLPPPISFGSVNAILQGRCMPCHSSRRHDGGIILDTEAGLRRSLDGVIQDVNSGRMPLGGAKIPQSEIDILEGYKAASGGAGGASGGSSDDD